MAEHASQLYAKNVQSLLELMSDKESGALKLDFDDEIIAGACITRDGEIVHEGARKAGRRSLTWTSSPSSRSSSWPPSSASRSSPRCPNTLHTPLMSGTNAIHGIVVLGGLLLIGPAEGFLNELLLVIAIAFGTINVVGGFLVTDRMLGMFKGKKAKQVEQAAKEEQAS